MAGAALIAAPAAAQRAGENAVASAADAFGSSVGNERVGLYNPGGARGFSPIQAGNVRIEGLYFDLQADLNDRLTDGWAVRVGLTAQGYPFPAPTGVADFSLRQAGNEAVLSTFVGVGPFGGVRLELDGQLPVNEQLGLAGGIGYNREEFYYGGSRQVISAAIIPRWRPTDGVEIMPFWSVADSSGGEAQPLIRTEGNAFLPPRLERRKYFGQSWAENENRHTNYGLLSSARLSENWMLRGGIFRSLIESDKNFVDISDKTTREGIADRYVLAEADRRFGSVSGEVRASGSFVEGDRLHIVHLAGRARQQKRRFGGGELVFIGRGRIDEVIKVPEPDFNFGPQTRDQVRQFTGGIGYEGRWRDVGELSLGIQKTNYRKTVETPTGPRPASKDSPWLMNGTVSIFASKALVFYAGYTKGLEESPVASELARNKDEAPPAIITEQMDAGFRYAFNDNLRLVAGVFDVKKPYYALDNTLLFRNLGTVQHRGVELSLAGQIAKGLNVVAGTVFLDAKLSGEEVEQGRVGKRPINAIGRVSSAAAEYRLPWIEGLSVDVAYESTSKRTANTRNTLFIPARYVWSPGFRYRFRIGDKPATLRGQIATANNVYGYNLIGEGFYYNFPRRYLLNLITDL